MECEARGGRSGFHSSHKLSSCPGRGAPFRDPKKEATGPQALLGPHRELLHPLVLVKGQPRMPPQPPKGGTKSRRGPGETGTKQDTWDGSHEQAPEIIVPGDRHSVPQMESRVLC